MTMDLTRKSSGEKLDRRTFLAAGGSVLAAGVLLGSPGGGADEKNDGKKDGKKEEKKADPTGPHKLPPLPYSHDALEPSIDKMTMEIHHGKHHQAYVTNLNKALEAHPALAAKPLEDLLRECRKLPGAVLTAVQNHGGGHHNHSLFWTSLKPNGGGEPDSKGKLVEAMRHELGGFKRFQEVFTDAALKHFGSGWAWLAAHDGKVHVFATGNQDSPLMQNFSPLLGLDVWEHAYYLKYQNRRADYIAAWWKVVDWEEVERRYLKSLA